MPLMILAETHFFRLRHRCEVDGSSGAIWTLAIVLVAFDCEEQLYWETEESSDCEGNLGDCAAIAPYCTALDDAPYVWSRYFWCGGWQLSILNVRACCQSSSGQRNRILRRRILRTGV